MNNTALWDTVFPTDPKHTKTFKRVGGFSGTAIKPLYLIHKATELWGPMGERWGAETAEHIISGNTVFIKCRLWYPGQLSKAWVEHWGGDVLVKGEKNIPNDEAFKMAFTDAVGKCLVQLGFSADVHLGLFDDSKYVAEQITANDNKPLPNEQAVEIDLAINALADAADYKPKFLKYMKVASVDKILASDYQKAMTALKTKIGASNAVA